MIDTTDKARIQMDPRGTVVSILRSTIDLRVADGDDLDEKVREFNARTARLMEGRSLRDNGPMLHHRDIVRFAMKVINGKHLLLRSGDATCCGIEREDIKLAAATHNHLEVTCPLCRNTDLFRLKERRHGRK